MANYYDTITPEVLGTKEPSTDIEYVFKKEQEELPEQKYFQAAASEAFVFPAVKRAVERRSSQFEEEAWEITPDMDSLLKSNYREEDEKYLRESKSKEEFVARQRFIKEDQDRLNTMASGGWKGIGAMLAFSLVDPVSIGLSMATGGINSLRAGNAVARAIKIGAMAGMENVAIDTALMQGNTQTDLHSLMLSFAAGSIIGGTVGAFSKAYTPKVLDEVKAADIAAAADADNFIIKKTVGEASSDVDLNIRKAFPEADARRVQADILEHETALNRNLEGAMSKTQYKKAKVKLKQLKKDIEYQNKRIAEATEASNAKRAALDEEHALKLTEHKMTLETIEAKYNPMLDAQVKKVRKLEGDARKNPANKKKADRLWKEEVKLEQLNQTKKARIKEVTKLAEAHVSKLDAKFADELRMETDIDNQVLTALSDEVLTHQDRMNRAHKAKMSAQELRNWNKMDDLDKVKHFYKDKEMPNRVQELQRQVDGYSPVRDGAPEEDSLGDLNTPNRSAGAAELDRPLHRIHTLSFDEKKKLADYAYDGAKMPENLRGRMVESKVVRIMHSAQTIISNSKDFAIRGFGYHLFEAPQGGSSAKVTVASRVVNFSNRIRGAMRNRLNEGLSDWGKENGLSAYDTLMKPKYFRTYNKNVMLEVLNPGMFPDSPGIIRGAEGVRAQLKEAGIINRDAGVGGFENLNVDENYVPIILNETAIKNALVNHSSWEIEKTISLGYQKGYFQLNETLSDRIAEAYVKRAKDHSLTMRDAVRQSTDKDINTLVDQLKKAGVDQDTIDDFLDMSMDQELKQHMSNRAKKSLRPDISVEYKNIGSSATGLRFVDLIDHDLPKLLESYTRDAAGGAAFAKLGFKTRREVLDFLTTLEKGSVNNGFKYKEIGEEIQILRDGVDLAYGRSINSEPHSIFVKGLSRIRSFTGFLRLQFNGVASIPELARITAQRGISNVLDECPDLGAFIGTKNLRKGGRYSGHFDRPDLEELDNIVHYAGEDHVLYPNGLRSDDIEEASDVGTLGNYFDNAIAQGRKVLEVASGFRTIQGTGEKLAIRTLASQIKKWALTGEGALSKANLDRAGWHDGFLNDVKAFMQANPGIDKYNGKEIRTFNFGKMAPEMQERLQIGMHRLVMHDMLRPMIGETPMFMHKWLGQTLTQFRAFSLLSLEKHLVSDIRHDKVMAGIMAMHSAALGYISLGIASMQANIGKENAWERLEAQMTGTAAVAGVINRMGQLASVGIGVDLMATLGLVPDEFMANPRQTGARAFSVESVPVVGMVGDMLEAPRAAIGAVTGKETASKGIKEVQDILPFAKAIGINQALNVLKGSLE